MSDYSTSALEIVRARPSFLATMRSAGPDFWTLTKPEVNFLIVIATFAGFYLGSSSDVHGFSFVQLLNTLLGALLVASGAGALNQCMEHRFDARMRRTSGRPVPAGRVRLATACWFGVALAIIGAVDLLVNVNAVASALAVFTLASYLFLYTPLKRKTPLCTLVGSIPGAMPPLIGWAAATGSIADSGAWLLYALLLLWQLPHVMAIAWMYREDYARAGYLMFPAKNQANFMGWQTLGPSLVLFFLTLAAVAANGGGILRYSATAILGSALLYYATRQVFLPSRLAARELLKATIFYLPLELLILVLCANRFDRSHSRGDRNGKRTCRPGTSRTESTQKGQLRQGKLRGDSRQPSRERAFRP